jgi:GT2 family glycosyltransferase
VLHLPFNHGFVRAANAGIALSLLTNSEYVLLLNSDTEIPKGDETWLQRLLEPMQDKSVGAVGAVSNNVAGYQRREKADTGVKDVPMLIGFCLLLRKEAVVDVGLLDEQFEPGNYEDFDYSIRLKQGDWKLAVAESVFIRHAMHASFKELDKTEPFNALLEGNRRKLEDKWGKETLRGVGL